MKKTLPITFYLPRLTDDGLLELISVTQECVQPKCRKLYEWLAHTLVGEHERRQSDEFDTPTEVALPDSAPFLMWSGGVLGSALRQVTIMSYIISDKSAGEFVDNVVQHVTSTVELRLTELDALRASRDVL
jgi:hypothetical protein